VTIVPVVFVHLELAVPKPVEPVTIITCVQRTNATLVYKVVVCIPIIPHAHSLLMVVRKLFAIEIKVVLKSLLTARKEDT
jgi:hypothetical protein